MNRILKGLAFACICCYLACGAGCKTTGEVVKDCGAQVMASLLPAIESALVSSNYAWELAQLAGQFGHCLIRNGVAHIKAEAEQDMQYASADVNARLKAVHAAKWLEANP